MLEPPNLAAVAASETTSEDFNKLPLLMRRVACGEQPVPSGNSTLTKVTISSIVVLLIK